MSTPSLNLLVLRAPNIEVAQRFYTLLGFAFTKHTHGSGPEHYAADNGTWVFEIYPQPDLASGTTATRIGFKVKNLDQLFAELLAAGATAVSAPKSSP